MKNHIPRVMRLPVFFILAAFASCHNDAYLTIPPAPPDVSFVQEFDTVTAAYDKGWRYLNMSISKGTGFWTQGLFNDPNVTGFSAAIPFSAWSSKGTYVGFIGADYTSTSAAAGIVSTWVVSPVTLMKTGDKIVFYTRSLELAISATDSTDFGNRLQVRLNATNDGLDVGNGLDPGDFSQLIMDINPKYAFFHTDPAQYNVSAYPSTWTKFIATVPTLPKPVKGRFAFRYYLEGGGYQGYGTAVALDSVAFISAK